MINLAFDCDISKEVRSVYLDISKAFDKVWYSGLIFKLKQNGVDRNILQPINSFFENRQQRTQINRKESE